MPLCGFVEFLIDKFFRLQELWEDQKETRMDDLTWDNFKSISIWLSDFKLSGVATPLASKLQWYNKLSVLTVVTSPRLNWERQFQTTRNTTLTLNENRGILTNIRLEQRILVNGSVVSEMVMESKSGQMVLVMKETGKIIEHKALESSLTLMETSMKEIGSTTRQMAMEFISMLMEQDMRATGWTIFSMAWEKSHGQMVQSMKVSI